MLENLSRDLYNRHRFVVDAQRKLRRYGLECGAVNNLEETISEYTIEVCTPYLVGLYLKC